ncbi:MAG: NTP transferase domain-containing protein [Marinilabiliaceae bacterium]|nr:NTP transferase domain-containing protein [Marinilabiliaceae bacterium]
MQAMIFAAGLGTRLRPLTDNMPKALVPLAGKPMLERVIDHFYSEGARRIVVNIHHFGQQIIDFLEENKHRWTESDIEVSDERGLLLDTGGGLLNALHYFDEHEPIVVGNADVLCNAPLQKLLKYHIENGNDATLLIRRRETNRQLLFERQTHLLRGWVNLKTSETKGGVDVVDLPDYDQKAFCGIHVVNPSLVKEMGDKGDIFGVTDAYLRICRTHRIQSVDLETGYMWYDIGTIEKLHCCEKEIMNK